MLLRRIIRSLSFFNASSCLKKGVIHTHISESSAFAGNAFRSLQYCYFIDVILSKPLSVTSTDISGAKALKIIYETFVVMSK